MSSTASGRPRSLWSTIIVTTLLSAIGGFLWIGRATLAVVAFPALLLAAGAILLAAPYIHPWLVSLQLPLHVAVLPFRRSSRPGRWYSHVVAVVVLSVLLSLLVTNAVRGFIFQPFRVPSTSMEPTLFVGDYFSVSKSAYGYGRYSGPVDLPITGRLWGAGPERGDVVVFRHLAGAADYVMRVVGLPGETVQMRDGVLHIDGVPVQLVAAEDPDSSTETSGELQRETLPGGASYLVVNAQDGSIGDDTRVFEIPEGHYFVLGDNRDNANDSRFGVGFVPSETLIGRAERVFWNDAGRTIVGRRTLQLSLVACGYICTFAVVPDAEESHEIDAAQPSCGWSSCDGEFG
jgi:signal peptidase I